MEKYKVKQFTSVDEYKAWAGQQGIHPSYNGINIVNVINFNNNIIVTYYGNEVEEEVEEEQAE